MKIYIFLLLSIGVYAWAELPDTVADKAINTNLENLDMKTAKAQKDINNVVNTTGQINIAIEIVTTDNSAATAKTVTCTSGKVVLGGGCRHDGGGAMYVVKSYPSSSAQWTCEYNNNGDLIAYAVCGKVR